MARPEPYPWSWRGLGAPLSEEEQMRLRRNTPLDRVIPWVDHVPDVAPSPLHSVQPFLYTATRFQAESPRVAFLCRSHALVLANKIDPSSVCPGVAKFKSDLSSRLMEDSIPTLQNRVKNTDAEELRSFILHYQQKDIRTGSRHPDYVPQLCALRRFIAVLLQVFSSLCHGFEDIAVEDGQVHHHKKWVSQPLSEEKALAEKVVFGGPSWKEDKMKIYQGLNSTASDGKFSRSFLKQWKFSLWNLGTSEEWMGGEGAEGAEIQRGRKCDLMEYKVIEEEEEFFDCSSSPLVD